jgi:UDP-2,3-diacylglucosamine pyrophosphatase LpxH
MFKLILSDLHLGAGGDGNRLEDFLLDGALAGLLDDAARESDASGQAVEVILNGDTFEFWQVPALADGEAFDPGFRYPDRAYTGTTASECAQRMRLIIAGHPTVFAALTRFLQPGPSLRWVTIIKGNHDVQLYWPAVQAVIRNALEARGPREGCLVFVSRTLLSHGLYIEHGNQYSDALNRHVSFENPVDPHDPTRLIEPPGARIFIHAINRMERDLPWISSVKPQTALVWLLLRYRPLAALRLLWLFLPALPTILRVHRPLSRSNRRIAEDAAIWQGVRPDQDAPQALVAGRTSEDLDSPPHLVVDSAPGGDPILSRGILEERALHAQLVQAAREVAGRTGARIVVLGHTHIPALEPLPDGAVYLNSGTWTWELDLRRQPADAWRGIIRDRADAQAGQMLTYVRIDSVDGVLVPTLRQHVIAAGASHDSVT